MASSTWRSSRYVQSVHAITGSALSHAGPLPHTNPQPDVGTMQQMSPFASCVSQMSRSHFS